MKQFTMFGEETPKKDEVYTSKIKAPIYEPNRLKPFILELFDDSKYKRLKTEIENSNLNEDEKKFLIYAASRHIIFNYEKIADFYAHSSKEVQELMEKSALVVIDFDKAFQYGFIQLADEISKQYVNHYGE